MLILFCLLMSGFLVSRVAPLIRRRLTPTVSKMVEKDVALNLWCVATSSTVFHRASNTAAQQLSVQAATLQESYSYGNNQGICCHSFYRVLCSHIAGDVVVRFLLLAGTACLFKWGSTCNVASIQVRTQ